MSPNRDDIDFILGQRARKKKRVERVRRRRRAGLGIGIVLLVLLGAAVVAGLGAGATLTQSCDLAKLRPPQVHSNTFIYARDGSRLGSIPSSENREPVSLRHMTPWLPQASVAIEDRRFYEHGGVDYVGIARAMWKDANAGKVVEGGSTITQQLVRNLYTGRRERTLNRKIEEACLAVKLSDQRSKNWILGTYLNTVFYGNHAFGVEAAAQTYFSRHAKDLTLLQAAMIAGLPQAPTDYDPFRRPQGALDRRDEVLRAMLSSRYITLPQYQSAVRSNSLGLEPGRIYTRIREPYFFSYVRDELQREYGANTVRSGGLRVYTTIDPRLQRLAAQGIRTILPYRSDPASAIVSVEPGTGAIRAMTAVIPGNTKNQFNLAAQSSRQAGSTFKTFVLASAIEQGIDPDSTYYTSSPFTCTTGPWCLADYLNGKPWEVTTYGHDYQGSISLTRATLSSDNTVYAQLTLDVGPDYVWRMAKRLGIRLTQKPVASIGLGSLSVSPLDMAAAYATFASGGIYAKPMAITKVVLPGGKVDHDAAWGKPQRKRALSEGVAWKVTDVLAQNALSGTGAGSGDGIHPNAGKTGTTSNHADAWFCGYTRELSTTVWMGYPRGEIPMLSVHGQEVAGATFPVPIWHTYMAAALWNRVTHPFLVPGAYPEYHSFVRGNYGSSSSYSGDSSYSSGTYSSGSGSSSSPPATTTTSAQPPSPAPQTTTPALQPAPRPVITAKPAPTPPPAPTPVPQPPPPPPTTPTEPTPTTPGPSQ